MLRCSKVFVADVCSRFVILFCVQVHAEPDKYYSLNNKLALASMQDMLQGKWLAGEDTDIIDDSCLKECMDASSSGPVWVFRVLHIAPQAQKAFQTVVNGIRNDHVAISWLKLTSKNPH